MSKFTMPSGDLLKRLFSSYRRGDSKEFFTAAQELIEEEQQRNHHVLARDLKKILENGTSRPVSSVHRFDLDQLPQDRERGTTLLEIRTPQRYLGELIISPDLHDQVEIVLNEYQAIQVLQANNLRARQKLLLAGPPGCGKTLCAEVIASELGLPLIYTRFDAVISSYLGETATNLRKVFEYAQRGTWVVFFDEFDAIGKSREDVEDHGELKRVVNTFLQLLDNFVSDSIFIAATNHERLLDKALWRRFDDILFFDLPTTDQIRTLIDIKLSSVRHRELNIENFVNLMVGWSHADVERVCIEAMKIAVLRRQTVINYEVFLVAYERQRRRLDIVQQTTK
jgi:ATP-dependent 26S proteasome regulatory subunit